MIQPLEFFANRIVKLSDEIKLLTRKIRWYGTFRLLSFIAIPALFILLGFSYISSVLSLVLFFLFLYLVKVHVDLQRKSKQRKILLSYYGKEKESLENWDFTPFDGGAKFEESGHAYSKDLGLFGNHSIFQMISRTHKTLGQKWLADELKNIPTSKSDIKAQQQSVKELSTLLDFREAFVVFSQENEIRESQFSGIRNWFDNTYRKSQLQRLKILGIVQTLLFVTILGLSIMGQFSFSLLILPFVTMGIFLGPHVKRVNRLLAQSDGISNLLGQLVRLFNLIEKAQFQTDLLKNKQSILVQKRTASYEIKQLFNAFKRLEYRQNLIVGLLLNLSCLWDAWSLLSVEKLKERFHKNFEEWVKVVCFFDAMNSKAQYAFNHPEANYADVKSDGGMLVRAVNAKHPLIHPQKCVANSYQISHGGEIKLVTGANMAGKSTFLRTVGVTHILACMGMPVFCEMLHFKPMSLFTSMLTVDDLSEEKSYFLAEVERLSQMVNFIQKRPDTLLIMDEILKGTNSHDKEEGSRLFIEKLIAIKATGIIATHDLNLTHMEDKFPDNIENLSFEVEQVGEEMFFDYTLRKGATKTMNAMQLLHNKGLIEL